MSCQYVPHTRIPTLVFATSSQASQHVAVMIESLIRQNNSAGQPTVLGLPTGSTPVGIYRALIRMHKEAGLDFSRVITFNLDEYFGLSADDLHSYRRWMQETFFNHVNIKPESIHIPDGLVDAEDAARYCAEYEQMIQRAGGIDLRVLMAQALLMGDEMHQRNVASTALLGQSLLPHLVRTVPAPEPLGTITEYLTGNQQLFLNVAMAAW